MAIGAPGGTPGDFVPDRPAPAMPQKRETPDAPTIDVIVARVISVIDPAP